MPKKFKHEPAAEAAPDRHISLQDFVRLHAPELLLSRPVMAGASALRFWQEIFQPPRPGEGKHWVNENLRWPYAERLIYLGREFCRLDERCQRYIIRAAQAGVWWRGDDVQRFRLIVAAQQNYRRLNPDEQLGYRKRLMQASELAFKRGKF